MLSRQRRPGKWMRIRSIGLPTHGLLPVSQRVKGVDFCRRCAERDCKLRVRDPPDSRGCHLLTMQRLRTNHLARRSLLAPEFVNKFWWQPAESQQDIQPERRNDEFDANVVSFQPRFLLQELIFAHCPHQPRLTRSREPPEQNGLALSVENCRPRVRNLAGLGDGQPLIASCWQFDLFSKMELTHHLFSTETFASPNTALMPSSPAASWLRNQQQQLSYFGCRPKPCEVDAQERRRRARALLEQAALWSPSPNEKT